MQVNTPYMDPIGLCLTNRKRWVVLVVLRGSIPEFGSPRATITTMVVFWGTWSVWQFDNGK